MSTRTVPPPGATVRYTQQYRRCGKKECAVCRPGAPGHGPYWFASWREDGRKRSCYLGRHPEGGTPPMPGIVAQPLTVDPAAPGPAQVGGVLLPLRVRTLGGLMVWRGAEAIPPARWRSRRASALFKLLLGAPGCLLSREEVVEALWPEADPTAAAHNLRTTVYLLRGILDTPGATASYVHVADSSISLVPGASGAPPGEMDWLDATAFARAAAVALAGRDVAACRAALARYTGQYLPEDGPAEWAVRHRDALQAQHLALLRHLADLSQEAGACEDAERALHAVLTTDPCDEEAARLLMRLQQDGGSPLQAIRTYRRLARALREDLDLEPDAETQALHAALIAAHPPPSDTALSATLPPNNLPAPLTSFIGRRREMAALREALAAPGTAREGEAPPSGRLLTLTGPGGCGKTRLALQVADDVLEHYPDGAWLVELAPVTDAGRIVETIVATLDPRRQGGTGPARPLVDLLRDLLRTKRLLLVLDNCEHLVGACADLVDTLLRACRHLRILATSREALRVPGEAVWPVPPLSLPTGARPGIGQLPYYEAVRLFLERAQAQRPDFALTEQNADAVVQICRQLDGQPLAIELAAARARLAAPEFIAARLDDCFRLLASGPRTVHPRHRTLRAALDWSYDLLTAPEQVLLRRLSTFSGGWTLGAVEAVCSDAGRAGTDAGAHGLPLAPSAVFDLLDDLVAKSLVDVTAERPDGSTRQRLLQTVRQYAGERLAGAGEGAAVSDRHLHWYVTLAEQAAEALTGPEQATWLARLEAEADNLRAALEWARQSGQVGAGLRLAGSLWRFWLTRGDLGEGRAWLESLLAQEDRDTAAAAEPVERRQAIRARALNGAGALAYYQCDYAAAAAFYTGSLDLLRQVGDTRGVASALNNLGLVHKDAGDYDGATQLYRESLDLYRSIGNQRGCAMALNNLGIAAGDQGNAARAAAYHEDSLALKRGLGDKRGIVTSLNNLGVIMVDQGDYARARALHEEGLALARALGNKWSEHVALSSLGRLAGAEGEYTQALAYYRDSLELCRLIGNDLFIAIILEGIAAICSARGDAVAATRLCAAAEALCVETGAALPASDRLMHERTIRAARAALGAEFDVAWTAGCLLGRERAIAKALAVCPSERVLAR